MQTRMIRINASFCGPSPSSNKHRKKSTRLDLVRWKFLRIFPTGSLVIFEWAVFGNIEKELPFLFNFLFHAGSRNLLSMVNKGYVDFSPLGLYYAVLNLT